MTKPLLSLYLLSLALPAQTPPAPAPAPDTATAAANPADQALVLDSARCANGGCQLGETLTLKFKNLGAWCNAQNHDLNALVLILDGRVMPGLHPIAPVPCDNELRFELKRLEDDQDASKQNREAWAALLSRAHEDSRTVKVNVGMEGIGATKPACFSGTTFKLRIFPSYTWVVYLFLGCLLVAFILLAGRSDVLRDPGEAKDDPNHPAKKPSGIGRLICGPDVPRRPFSLARFQMAWWFFIVLGAYHYIWLVSGDRNSLTPGVLILIGISAATGLGAMVIDNGRPASTGTTKGFLLDILREDDAVSFHRFQMAVWTIVLGFVFAISVYQSLSMPEINATLLGLMGISSGTYIGFKIPDPPK